MLPLILAQSTQELRQVAEWQTFPFGALFTLTGMLSALLLAALSNHFRDKFMSQADSDKMGKALRLEIADQKAEIQKMRGDLGITERVSNDALRNAQQLERAVGDQWKRISEELIQPIRDMSKELRDTRETLVRYVQTQDGHGKEISRLEKQISRLEGELERGVK